MKKAIFWGMGRYAEFVYKQLKEDIEIICAVDSDESKQNKFWIHNLKICNPSILTEVSFDFVIVSPQNYFSIKRQIEELGISVEKIECFWEEKNHRCFIPRTDQLKNEVVLNEKYRARLDSLPYELGVKSSPEIQSSEKLLELIFSERKSLCRFGDGEFSMIFNQNRPWFQTKNENLGKRLLEVFKSDYKKILTAVAQNFKNFEFLKESTADDIRLYMEGETRKQIIKLFDKDKEYFNAYVSRPYIIYKNSLNAQKIFALWQKIFYKRNIVLVEGANGRFGIGNNLLDMCRSVKRISCPPKNSWEKYEEIKKCVENIAQPNDLICISLGPTATVLAYDLAVLGYQAIDIGQLDNEYDWYLMNAKDRCPIPGKFVAEITEPFIPNEEFENIFRHQLVTKI
ncbi:GT-D fold domain-containing glycosyltransferase [Enterococcus cecorum]|uniref:GT-D fold domain-containing glycosyltransferase n=1 Tax=Enterococcus cecorum TaxID=44008 RepID=UPI0032C4171D